MSGSRKAYTYMPYFYSDLFEFGYEAVGEVSTELDTFADWQQENEKGIIYYQRDGRVRGAMMCNMPDMISIARELILKQDAIVPAQRRLIAA